MSKFRKKPVVIEATQWFPHVNLLPGVVEDARTATRKGRFPAVSMCAVCGAIAFQHGYVETLEGGHIVCPGDWIITGVKGEHYPCKPDIFALTYESVPE